MRIVCTKKEKILTWNRHYNGSSWSVAIRQYHRLVWRVNSQYRAQYFVSGHHNLSSFSIGPLHEEIPRMFSVTIHLEKRKLTDRRSNDPIIFKSGTDFVNSKPYYIGRIRTVLLRLYSSDTFPRLDTTYKMFRQLPNPGTNKNITFLLQCTHFSVSFSVWQLLLF